MSISRKLIETAAGSSDDTVPFVEEVFSTYLYAGNSFGKTILNGIDLDGEGGLVWIKRRSASGDHALFDTERGRTNPPRLRTNGTDGNIGTPDGLNYFNPDGFRLGAEGLVNKSGDDYVSWTWRLQPKFFDVVTYTTDGSTAWEELELPHNLKSVPGAVFVKRIDTNSEWWCAMRKDNTSYVTGTTAESFGLNSTRAAKRLTGISSCATDTTFKPALMAQTGNAAIQDGEYVAYLFGHDDSAQSIIKCGSYTGNGSTANDIDIGFEPQWVLIKNTTSSNQWYLFDVMRGIPPAPEGDAYLLSGTNGKEVSSESYIDILSNGFSLRDDNAAVNADGSTYIYMAIRKPDTP